MSSATEMYAPVVYWLRLGNISRAIRETDRTATTYFLARGAAAAALDNALALRYIKCAHSCSQTRTFLGFARISMRRCSATLVNTYSTHEVCIYTYTVGVFRAHSHAGRSTSVHAFFPFSFAAYTL